MSFEKKIYVFSDAQANLLLTKLRDFVLCGVQMSGRFGNEIAYDFT
jgi:hypothetical protein